MGRSVRPPTCGFTNDQSARKGQTCEGCCTASSVCETIRRWCMFIGCLHCIRQDNIIWRCIECYIKFALVIKCQPKKLLHPVIELLISYDWSALTQDKINTGKTGLDDFCDTRRCKWRRNGDLVLFFTKSCPCCYNTSFPIITPVHTIQHNALTANIRDIQFRSLRTPILDTMSGSLMTSVVRIFTVLVKPVLNRSDENKYIYNRLSDDTKNYASIEAAVSALFNVMVDDRIVVLAQNDSDNDSRMMMLSMKHVGALYNSIGHSVFREDHEIQLHHASIKHDRISSLISKMSRYTLPETSQDNEHSRKAIKTVLRLMPPYYSAYSTGRRSGPHGHISGESLNPYRAILTSGLVVNGLPRIDTATILVPIKRGYDDEIITAIAPFYMAISKEEVVKVTHDSIPRQGWNTPYKRFVKLLYSDHTSATLSDLRATFDELNVIKTIIATEATSYFSACFIMLALAEECKSLCIDLDPFYVGVRDYENIIQSTTSHDMLLRNLCSYGRQTLVIAPVFGHRDCYDGGLNRTETYCIESKFVLTLGVSMEAMIPYDNADGNVPVGSLAFPRYKIMTECMPLNDVEFHFLADVVHLVGNNKHSNERGAIVPQRDVFQRPHTRQDQERRQNRLRAARQQRAQLYPNAAAVTRMSKP